MRPPFQVVIVIIVIALLCLVSTILMFMFGSKMPVVGDEENKLYLIGTDIVYVLCTIICCLIMGTVIYKFITG